MTTKISPVETVNIPEGVKLDLAPDGTLTATGAEGEVKRKFRFPHIKIVHTDNALSISVTRPKPTKREKTIIGTYKSHIRNIFHGVTDGHTYRLKVCSGHFPMSVSVSGDILTIKNFFGEKIPRTMKISTEVKVKVEGAELIVTSPNKEAAGQCALKIEQLTRRTAYDRRIFQDGIYILKAE